MKNLNLIKSKVVCKRCGRERYIYTKEIGVYGERTVTTLSGNSCGYVNLFDDIALKELNDICEKLLSEKDNSLTNNQISRIVSRIYGITCDEINGEKVSTVDSIHCPYCLTEIITEDKEYGEKLITIEAEEVTHNKWDGLSDEEKKELVREELERQQLL